MKDPIFTYEENDLTIFETKSDAELYLEPYDVGTYEVFDAEGRLLTVMLTGTDADTISLRKVKILDSVPERKDPLRLKNILADFLSYVKVGKGWLENATLEELIQKSLEYKTK